jgi:hypothetical protein
VEGDPSQGKPSTIEGLPQPRKSHTNGRRNRPEQPYKDFQKSTGRSFIGRSNLQRERGTGSSPHNTATPERLTAKYIHYLKRKKATSGNFSDRNRREDTLAKGQHPLL